MKGIVVKPLKLTYWFVPKAACTTMKVYFADLLGLEYTNPHTAKFTWTPEPLNGYTDFAIVRNPYARLWSLYNCWDEAHTNTIYSKYPGSFYKGMEWDTYIDRIVNIKNPDRHFIPQTYLIPETALIEKMEESVLLHCFGKHNFTGSSKEFPHDERVYNHYKQDFERFGYDR